MDIRECFTPHGLRVERNLRHLNWPRVVHMCIAGADRPLCAGGKSRRRVAEVEPELRGTKQAWRNRTRDYRRCQCCSLRAEEMLERANA